MVIYFFFFCFSDTWQETNVCNGIKVGDEVTFKLTLEITHCVDQRDFVLKIGPSGLDETLVANVHVQCDCDCEKEVCAVYDLFLLLLLLMFKIGFKLFNLKYHV